MPKFLQGLLTGGVGGGLLGFILGIFLLPILIAEDGASAEVVQLAMDQAERKGTFRRNLEGSDFGHWGDGEIILSRMDDGLYFVLNGEISPGPDYRLYLAPRFVETGAEFLKIKAKSKQVNRVKAFTNFRIKVPDGIDTDAYSAVVIWCERFRQFITAAEISSPSN